MKVLLKQDVDNLGYAGEVMKVADGFGRNYLIPKGLAVRATPSVLKEASNWRERAAARMDEIRKEHEALSARIVHTHLNFTARAGETGKLYGSITTADIIDQLNKNLGTEIDRKTVMGGPLRQLGEHHVTIRLGRDYNPQVTVYIHPHDESEIEASEAEEEAVELEVETEELAEDIEPTLEVEE